MQLVWASVPAGQLVGMRLARKNAASFGVMKKIGMTLVDDKGTRTYPKTGITSGEFTCLITRKEWEKRGKNA